MEKQAIERRWATRAVRGATTVESNTREAILNGAAELVQEVLSQNDLVAEDIVSIIFTVTHDLNAEFPAAGARRLGLTSVPLLCATEIQVPGSLPRCIRCLAHINTLRTQLEIRHVYLRDARTLRPDLP